VGISATPASGYSFSSWTGSGSGSYSGSSASPTITMNGPITELANFTANNISVTVQTSPSGRSFTVDGITYTTPQTFSWVLGNSHTIATTSPQSGGTGIQYLWSTWSDGGATSHTVAPTVGTTYTANFTTQYYLTMGYGTGGSSVSPGSGWYNSGTSMGLGATPASGYNFSSWTGSGTGSYSGSSPSSSITMNAPITELANFVLIPDTTPPTVSISSPTSGQTFTTSPVTVSGTATDPGTPSTGVSLVQVQVNGTGGTWQPASGTTSWNASVSLSLGGNTIYVRSQDGAGNYSTIASVSVTYTPDTQGPALTITSPANNATVTNASLPVNGTASDNGLGNNGISSVTVNGVSASGGTASGAGTANWNATIPLNAGANMITVVAKDTLNNSTQKVVSVTYNPQCPVFGGSSVTSGKLKTTLTGLSVGEKIVISMSTDLKNWSPIQTNIASGPTLSVTNSIIPAMNNQYFRAMVQ